jgi:hypothetical protein
LLRRRDCILSTNDSERFVESKSSHINMQRRSNAPPEEPVEPLDESEQVKVIRDIVRTFRTQQTQITTIFTIVCCMAMGIAVFITYIVQSEDTPARHALLASTVSPHLPTLRYLHCLCTMLLHWNTPKIVGHLGPKSEPPSLNELIPVNVSLAWSIYVPMIASLLVGALALWMVRGTSGGSTDYHALYYHYILWGGNAVLMGAATFIRRDQEAFIASLKELHKSRYGHKTL